MLNDEFDVAVLGCGPTVGVLAKLLRLLGVLGVVLVALLLWRR